MSDDIWRQFGEQGNFAEMGKMLYGIYAGALQASEGDVTSAMLVTTCFVNGMFQAGMGQENDTQGET